MSKKVAAGKAPPAKEAPSDDEEPAINFTVTAEDPKTLVLLLKSPEHSNVIIPACQEITAFAEGGNANRRRLLELGAIPLLLDILERTPQDGEKDELLLAVSEALVMSSRDKVVRAKVRTLGGLRQFIGLLRYENKEIKLQAAHSMCLFSQDEEALVMIRNLRGLEPLAEGLPEPLDDLNESEQSDSRAPPAKGGKNSAAANTPAPADDEESGGEVLERFVEALANCAIDYQNKVDIKRLTGLDRMFRILAQSDTYEPMVQQHSSLAIARCLEERTNQDYVLEMKGGMSVLMKWLKQEDVDDIQVTANVATALANMSTNRTCRPVILKEHSLEPLVGLVEGAALTEEGPPPGGFPPPPKDEEDEDSLGLSGTGGSGEGEEEAIDPEIVAVATAAASSATCLSYLATDANVRSMIRNMGAFRTVINVLAMEEEEEEEGGTPAAAAKGAAKGGKDAKAGGKGGKTPEPETVEVGAQLTLPQQSAVRCLASLADTLTENDPLDIQNKIMITSQGGLVPLVSILQDGSAYPDVQADAALCLARCASRSENREVIRGLGVFTALVQLLSSQHEGILENAALAVANCAYDADSRQDLISEGVTTPLLELVKTATVTPIQKNAALAIANTCLNADARHMVHEVNAIPALLDMVFKSTNLDVRRNALLAMTICSRDSAIAIDICRDGALEEIHILSTSKDSKIAGYAASTVDKITKQFPAAKFWLRGVLEVNDITDDGFYDLGRYPHFHSLDFMEKLPVSRHYSILHANTADDEIYKSYLDEIEKTFVSLDRTDTRGRIVELAKFISKSYGGKCSYETYDRFEYEDDVYSAKLEGGSNVVDIGKLRRGACRERAFLFKAIADKHGIQCKLVRSKCKRGALALQTWNVVPLGAEDFVVDLMHDPGALYPESSEDAAKYQRVGKWMFSALAMAQEGMVENDVPLPRTMQKGETYQMKSSALNKPLAHTLSEGRDLSQSAVLASE